MSIDASKLGEIIEDLGGYFDWEAMLDKGEEVDREMPVEVEERTRIWRILTG